MLTHRRNFLAGAGLSAGLGAMPMMTAKAATLEPSGIMPFGPVNGQALLSRNENPYGPAPSAIKAVYD
ncbi:MAG: histidinol-phosphate aminotransferase family protein, partial [Pseudomonadota bacterium]